MPTLNITSIHALLGNTDIYLIDQIMKDRYRKGDILLDAGCGGGRNLHWFLKSGFVIYGIDTDTEAIRSLRESNPALAADRFVVSAVEHTAFKDVFFDHIISSAVLHFARNEAQFFSMIAKMVRILKPGGTLFIRMASDIGIEQTVVPAGDGVYFIPDGSTRFLLTRSLLAQLLRRHPLSLLEEFKTVNVNDIRCMSTLVMAK